MSWTTTTSFDLHQIIDKGFPIDPKFHETLKGDQGYNIDVTLKFETLGYESNGFDDPGEGPEFYIDKVEFEGPELEGFLPLSDSQQEWLELYIGQNEATDLAIGIADSFDYGGDY